MRTLEEIEAAIATLEAELAPMYARGDAAAVEARKQFLAAANGNKAIARETYGPDWRRIVQQVAEDRAQQAREAAWPLQRRNEVLARVQRLATKQRALLARLDEPDRQD